MGGWRPGILLVALLALAATPPGEADASGLDPTFGNGGLTVTSIAEEPDLPYAGPGQLRDGSLIGVTMSSRGLVRWSADGAELGVRSGFGPVPNAMTDDGAGGVLTAGAYGHRLAVGALSGDGAFNAGFGDDGLTQVGVPYGVYAQATAISRAPDGSILAAGRVFRAGSWRLLAVRLRPDGKLDRAFGRGGLVVTTVPGTHEPEKADASEWTNTGAVMADRGGRVLLAGTVVDVRTRHARVVVLRYRPTGGLDPSFGHGKGYVTLDFRREVDSAATAMAWQADAGESNILVAGWTTGQPWSFGLLRLRPSGSLDRTFGRAGRVVTGFGGNAVVGSIQVLPGGRVLAVGHPFAFNEPARITLARYRPDGGLDPTFGAGGRACTDIPYPGEYGLVQLGSLLLADGRLVVGGILNADRVSLFVARYQAVFTAKLDCVSVVRRRRDVAVRVVARRGARLALDVSASRHCSVTRRRFGRVVFPRFRRSGLALLRWSGRVAGRRLPRRQGCFDVTPLSLGPGGQVEERLATQTVEL
jgi:uncharacterized delta-60 repeat protein